MGTTNSADKTLNKYNTLTHDNSGVPDIVVTNTGNEKRKNGLPVYNDTYTLSTVSNKYAAADINVKLLDWNSAVAKKGDEILTTPGFASKAGFESDKVYSVYGHPDKFVYDYQQEYNNCGVDSCLNVLSIAGVKDIVEVGQTYSSYLTTPIVKVKNQTVYDSETGSWKTETVETTTYPKAEAETEHEFLLWAVQNSPNDSAWYKDIYYDGIPKDGNIPILGDEEIDDYVVHSKNYEEYKTIEDIQATPTELGGTNAIHRDNILNYWGVESNYKVIEIESLMHAPTEAIQEGPTYTINENGEHIRTTITTSYDEFGQAITVNTLVEKLEVGDPEDTSTWVTIWSEETTETTYTPNAEFYSYLTGITNLVKEGKGVVIGGYAEAFRGGKGGRHAITIVGVVEAEGDGKLYKEKSVTTTYANNPSTTVESKEYTSDIMGVYVIDTGGWITDGLQSEQAQFVDCFTLYNFLTDTEYDKPYTFETAVNYTIDEIRSWADNLNIVGNDRKNVLLGNESQNYIWGGKGNDVIEGRGGNDYLYGDQNNDTIYGGRGNDVMTGGTGDDLYVLSGDDFIEDVATNDVTTSKGSHDYIIVGKGKDSIQFDTIETTEIIDNNICNVTTTIDDIYDMQYQNRDGNLVITYGITKTTSAMLDGTIQEQTYNNNSITVENYFSKQLYNSIDKIIQSHYIKQEEIYILYQEFNFIQDVLSRGYIDYFTYQEKNNTIKGSKFMDSIIGGNRNDSITGGDANDIINGGASDDTIKSGKHDDTIYGSYGNDKLYGEAGDDIIKYQKEATLADGDNFAGGEYGGHDTIYSGSGYDVVELFDYSRSELTFTKAQNDLVISYGAKADGSKTGGSITIANYFSKKGNTSIKAIRLADGSEVVSLQAEYETILALTANVTGTDGYDLIKGTAGDDSLVGGIGHDTLYGANGNDTLNGGTGSDKLYGQAGDNTYIFDSKALGEDTIYTSGNGKSTLDFTGSGVNFTSKGATDAINEYSFTKVKNDLIINYSNEADYSDSDNALIRIASFFSSKGDFEIKNADGSILNLKEQATIYMNGDDEEKNKITGSNYNDLIIGYDYNDTFKGGKGNDTLIGGKGNDNLTGGAGNNVIQYTKGDGIDTINLTKGENLNINLTGFELNQYKSNFDYEIVNKDLVISYINQKGAKEQLLIIKNFGAKDVVGATGSVKMYHDGVEIMDLRLGNYLDKVINFTPKKYSYTGKWQSEVIDTRALNIEANSKGAKVNDGGGNDTIYGSDYNDTLNGGDGDDHIYGSFGTNKLDGGKGSDTYYLFDTSISNTNSVKETTTIKDTGKVATDIDTAYILSSLEDITTEVGEYKQQGSIWFNVKVDGSYTTTFNVVDANGNKATITGVENILVGETAETAKTYNYEALASTVATWLSSNGFKDVNTVMKSYDEQAKNELLAIFTDASNFS